MFLMIRKRVRTVSRIGKKRKPLVLFSKLGVMTVSGKSVARKNIKRLIFSSVREKSPSRFLVSKGLTASVLKGFGFDSASVLDIFYGPLRHSIDTYKIEDFQFLKALGFSSFDVIFDQAMQHNQNFYELGKHPLMLVNIETVFGKKEYLIAIEKMKRREMPGDKK
jgi:hypothetical protein